MKPGTCRYKEKESAEERPVASVLSINTCKRGNSYCQLYFQLVNAGEDVLIFYNDRASFNHFVEMMRCERHRMDESSALRFVFRTYCAHSLTNISHNIHPHCMTFICFLSFR
jgi:hypothetical protein